MIRKQLTLSLLLVSLCVSSTAANRCVDAAGQVTYQDLPCLAGGEIFEVGSEGSATPTGSRKPTTGSTIVLLPGIGEVAVMTFDHWEVTTTEAAKDQPVTLKLVSSDMDDPLSIQLTFVANQEEGPISFDAQKAAVTAMAEQFLPGAVEESVGLRTFRAPLGDAILANFNEKKYQQQPVPAGEYPSITVGLIANRLLTVAVTILSNGPATRAHDDALTVLNSLLLFPN